MTPTPVLCLAPVDWPQVASRPRQLMTRLAADRPVYFFETQPRTCRLPLVGSMRAGALTVLTPYLPEATSTADGHRLLAPLLEASLDSDGARVPIVWSFDAQSLPLVAAIPTRAIVFDCGLEPAGSATTEASALARADVVFAADIAQYARLRPRHEGVHFVPGSTSWASTCSAMLAIVDGATPGGPATPSRTGAPKTGRYRVIRGGAEAHRRQPWL